MKQKKEEISTVEVQNEQKEQVKNFYNDLTYSAQKRRNMWFWFFLMLFFIGGPAVTIILSKNTTSYLLGAILLILIAFMGSRIPSVYKQYPKKKTALVSVRPKEITINDETFKLSDVVKVRMTVTLPSVGKKEENQKFIDSVAKEKPQTDCVGDLDFVVKKDNKETVLYTTVANAGEAIIMLYGMGIKRCEIFYSLKKLSVKSSYDLSQSVVASGEKLENLSKKERRKQLF